ncbi:MAG: hypothetical protein RI955_725 [Bacteroidota bacterium]|jgi:uncharacterized protein YndB with AHSA1/START domain
MNNAITVEAIVNASIEKVWNAWITPQHIMQWNNASPDWHCPAAENNLQVGGKFTSTMAAKDGSFSFDFGGTHTEIKRHELIASTMDDGRKMEVRFIADGDKTKVVEAFEPENENPLDMQQAGWQAILDNFKKHVEAN